MLPHLGLTIAVWIIAIACFAYGITLSVITKMMSGFALVAAGIMLTLLGALLFDMPFPQ